jgi:hypothetical protein
MVKSSIFFPKHNGNALAAAPGTPIKLHALHSHHFLGIPQFYFIYPNRPSDTRAQKLSAVQEG